MVEGLEEFAKPPRAERKRERGGGEGKGQAKRKKPKRPKVEAMSAEELAEFEAEHENRGIVYISRVPPFMKPEKVRHELQKHGTIKRIYLTPEDRVSHLRRKKYKGNSKKNYTDGWVEFADKVVRCSTGQ